MKSVVELEFVGEERSRLEFDLIRLHPKLLFVVRLLLAGCFVPRLGCIIPNLLLL